MKKVIVIPGDGIGPEILDATLTVLDKLVSDIEFIRVEAGFKVWQEKGYPISDEDLELIKKYRLILKGPIATPVQRGMYKSVNVLIRKTLDLYANVRLFRSIPGISPFENVNMVIVRENTEGLYAGIECKPTNDTAISLRVITRKGSERVIDYAFRYAVQNNRKKVTIIHKANILRETCGLFLEIAREVAKRYPQIEMDEVIVDAAAYKMIKSPEVFDVVVTTNMFGDILSDEVAALVGSLGLVPSMNVGDNGAMFEAVHGTALDIAGKGIANPTGLLLSAALMLRYLGKKREADILEKAVLRTLEYCRTPDLGGSSTTKIFVENIIKNLEVT